VVADKIKAGSITMETTFPVSENAWRHGAQSDGSHMFLELNSRVSVRDLIGGVVIVSANDACIVLAEGIAGSEEAFVDLMNKRAAELGLKTARFRNVTGLPDPDHVISAADLARLSRYIIATHPEFYKLYSQPTFTYNTKTQENRNPLLGRFAGADGIKTGHTSASGYGLVGSALVNGKRRIVVFNGLPTMAARATEAERLMRAAFYDFDAQQVYKKGEKVGDAAVWLGSKKTVPLVTTQAVDVGFHRSAKSALKASIVYDGPLPAPIKKGDVVAKLIIEGPGVPKQEIPLAAANKVGRKGFIGRAMFGANALLGSE
jgi:D-alanyl-D-alanine carboxypeptidase (penicillin-binding protein 5/6)